MLKSHNDFSKYLKKGILYGKIALTKSHYILIMSLAAFDTLAYSKKLIASGVTPKQAEAQAELQAQILSELVHDKLATKEDILILEHKSDHLDSKIDQTRMALDAKIDQVETKLERKIDRLEATVNGKFNLLYWMMGIMLSGLAALLSGGAALFIKIFC